MNRRLILPALITLAAAAQMGTATAQDEIDALRYSYLSPQGTARSMGFGNALGSVGGDVSSLSVNPAGIGIYRSSEILVTPGIRFNGTNSTYLNTTTSDNATRFNINNFGVVFTGVQKGRRYKNSSWKTFSFGMGVNRMADFNRDYSYSGMNGGPTGSSASEVFVADANRNYNSVDEYGSPAWFGYSSYLIDFDTSRGRYYTNVPYDGNLQQQRIVKERGGLNEYYLSFGGNYEEKLMLGMTIGIPSLNYRREASYIETDVDDYSPVFHDFVLSEKLTTTGIGINAKLGFIYKPNDQFRVGAALHTPTAFAMSDVYEQSLKANTEGYAEYFGDMDYTWVGPRNEFNYTLTTPWRGILSGTAMMGKMGFVSVDYEYVNYRSARYRFRTDDIAQSSTYREFESIINQSIRDAYQAASNIRAGVEVRLQPVMVRGGVGYYGSPYTGFPDGSRLDFSAGLGFRFDQAFIDLGFRHSQYQNKEQPYVLPADGVYEGVTVPTARIKNSFTNVAFTLGFKF